MNSAGGKSVSVSSTPTITAAAYSVGDQVGGVNALQQVAMDINRVTSLCALTMIVKATNADTVTYNIWFFDRNVTLSSTDKSTLAISQANAAYVVGKLTIDSCFFTKPGGTAGFAIAQLNVPASALPMTSGNSQKNLYYVLEVSSASSAVPTFAATSDISFNFVFNQDF